MKSKGKKVSEASTGALKVGLKKGDGKPQGDKPSGMNFGKGRKGKK